MTSLLAFGLFTALFILWFAGSAMAGRFTGHVIRVVDGDTIELLHNQRPECMLLRGIDCPEKGTDNLRADCPRPEV
jgi:endonuclease YncB( thermonuclease family)